MKGFTLLELLVSVGILAVVSILIVQVFFTTTRVNTQVQSSSELQQNGTFAVDAMSRMIRGAMSVAFNCNEGATTTPSAALSNYDGDTTTLTCMSDGSVARVASVSGEGAVVYLTGSSLTTSLSGASSCDDTTLSFSCPAISGIAEPVHLSFSLGTPGAAIDPTDQTTLFQATVNVRSD